MCTNKDLPFIYANGGRKEDDLRLLLVMELNHVTPVGLCGMHTCWVIILGEGVAARNRNS